MTLSTAHTIFVDHYCEHGNATAAYKAAGFKPDKSNAKRLLNRLAPYINDAHQKRMAAFAGVALGELERIIAGEETHARDKINAVNSYLDRCGIARASTVNMNATIPPEPKKKVKRFVDREGRDEPSVEVDISTNPDFAMWLPAKLDQPEWHEDAEWDMTDEATVRFLNSRQN
jgi:phage terminase small subunit